MSPVGYVECVAMSEKEAVQFMGLKPTRVEDMGPADRERYKDGARVYRLYVRDLRVS
jgi:hypothetical protein